MIVGEYVQLTCRCAYSHVQVCVCMWLPAGSCGWACVWLCAGGCVHVCVCGCVQVVVCRWLCAGVHVVCRCVCEVCVWLCAGVCTLPCCGRSARGWHWCQLGCGVCPADVDDCAASPCCQQVCTNSPGGYECSCYAGYRLSADGCGCEGEWWAAGVAGEWAVLRMTRGGLWRPPSTLSLGVGLMPQEAA